MVEWMGQNLMFSLVSRKFLAMRNIVLYSVPYHVRTSFDFLNPTQLLCKEKFKTKTKNDALKVAYSQNDFHLQKNMPNHYPEFFLPQQIPNLTVEIP